MLLLLACIHIIVQLSNIGGSSSPIVYIAAEFDEDLFFTGQETEKNYVLGDPNQPNDNEEHYNGPLQPATRYTYFVKCFPDLTPGVSMRPSLTDSVVITRGCSVRGIFEWCSSIIVL